MKKLLSIALLSQLAVAGMAQVGKYTDERVLFTVGGDPVKVKEFEYVYNKNNINNTADYSETSLREYLDLYEKFRLQVKESETLRLDTISALRDELSMYQVQLANSYMVDKGIMTNLMNEAYNRMQEEIHVAHILVQCKEGASAADTAIAWKKINDIRKRLPKESFAKLATDLSEDLSAKTNQGDLGWITSFKTIYAFENMAYNTKVGEVSKPFRTPFGYHILKVYERRPNRGEIKTAQVFFSEKQLNDKPTVDSSTKQKTAWDVYQQLKSGSLSWDSAVVKFSEDNFTRQKKGELPWMQSNGLLKEYAEAAYALQDNAYSTPIRTSIGWHIVKRIGTRPLASFENMQTDLKSKVSKDSRSEMAKANYAEEIKKQYGFNENPAALSDVKNKIDTSFMRIKWKAPDKSIFIGSLFTIGDKKVSSLEFVEYLEKNQKIKRTNDKDAVIEEMYANFKRDRIFDYKAAKLSDENPDFAATMKEYREGIFIFDLRDKMVWSKAVKDTVGLRAFWEKNKSKWLYGPRLDVTIFTTSDSSMTKSVLAMLKKKKSAEQITAKLNVPGSNSKVSVLNGKYEKGTYELLNSLNFTEEDAGKILTEYDAPAGIGAAIVRVNQLLPPMPKELKDTKGYVVSEYQEFLEKNWIEELRLKYPIVENAAVFSSLIKR